MLGLNGQYGCSDMRVTKQKDGYSATLHHSYVIIHHLRVVYLVRLEDTPIAGGGHELESLNVWEKAEGRGGVWRPAHMDYPAADVGTPHVANSGMEGSGV